MKFTIDLNLCEDHGQCAYAAPELFSLDDDGAQVFRGAGGAGHTSDELAEAEAAAAERAAAMCPMQAISVTG